MPAIAKSSLRLSRGELGEERQNSRRTATETTRQPQFGVSALAGEQSVDESAKLDADQSGTGRAVSARRAPAAADRAEGEQQRPQ